MASMPLRISRSIMVLAIVVSACTGTSAETTTTTTPGTGTTTGTTSPVDGQSSTTTAPPVTDLVLEWSRIDDPAFDGGRLNAAVAAGPGVVAVGTDELPEDAAVWVSSDGRAWERIASESFAGVDDSSGLEGTQFMSDVIAGSNGIVAVGGYERRDARDLDPGVWLSQDGLEWERVDDDDFVVTGDGHLNAVIDWNGTLVAVGENPGPVGSGETRPAVWTSHDGHEWSAVDSFALRVDGVISSVTRRGSRLYAVGSIGHVARPTVWFSDDGEAWDIVTSEDLGDSVVGSIEVGDAGELEDMFMTSVAVTPNGFVAAGGIGFPSRAAFWESSDGLFWTLTAVLPDVERATMPIGVDSLITTTDALVAVGSGQLDATRFPPISFAEVWLSFDGGLGWAQFPRTSNSFAVAGPTSPWHIGGMNDVIRFDGGLLAVGYVPYQEVVLPGPFYHQAAWLGVWE